MLVPLRTQGSKPPLFFVHGIRGFAFELGPRFAGMLGADQPVYLINANGVDGQQPVIEHVEEMVSAYLQEIRQARPVGPVRIGGMCQGAMVAIEIARALQHEGRQTGPVILLDPPVLTPNYATIKSRPVPDKAFLQDVYEWLRQKALGGGDAEEMPFNFRDPKQLQSIVVIARCMLAAFARYVPRPFSGSIHAIISARRAPGFLHPQMPWTQLLTGTRLVHVLPWAHWELLRPGAGRITTAGLMRFMLEGDLLSESLGRQKTPDDAALIADGSPPGRA